MPSLSCSCGCGPLTNESILPATLPATPPLPNLPVKAPVPLLIALVKAPLILSAKVILPAEIPPPGKFCALFSAS